MLPNTLKKSSLKLKNYTKFKKNILSIKNLKTTSNQLQSVQNA